MIKVKGGDYGAEMGCNNECGISGDPACPTGTTSMNTGCGGGLV